VFVNIADARIVRASASSQVPVLAKRLRQPLGHVHVSQSVALCRGHLAAPVRPLDAQLTPLTEKLIEATVRRPARRVNLRNNGPHILRHTFCSHLAMRGAARVIQELAGHREAVR